MPYLKKTWTLVAVSTNNHMYLESVSPEEHFKNIYKTTPLSVFVLSPPKKAKNGTLIKQTLGTTDQKLGMYTQHDYGSDLG